MPHITHIDTQQGVHLVSRCCSLHRRVRRANGTITRSSLQLLVPLGGNTCSTCMSTHRAAAEATVIGRVHRSHTISIYSGRICSVSGPSDGQQQNNNPWKLLEEFTRADFRRNTSSYLATRDARQTLRDAFFHATTHKNDDINWNPETSPILLGILSSDVRLAIRSLRDYTGAMNADFVLPEVHTTTTTSNTNDTPSSVASMRGSVYIRYRKQQETIQCTITPYTGNDRGVLVQFGNLQVGHLPLGLIDEDMKTPLD